MSTPGLWEWAACAIVWSAMFADILRLVSNRTFLLWATVGSFLASGYEFLVSNWAWLGVNSACCVFFAWQWWRHRNDDDDTKRGRRLKAWAKNKLRKFAPVAIRPIEVEGSRAK